ncbi:MAG TPA: endonuclease/exonuclease/phosphatase family protein [Actinomycetota bacterium]|nr:endonuclease/exonuclease/phosphatase family protein [Actinomycetota bacterium]
MSRPLRVMSFNIRFGLAMDPLNRWGLRRDAVVETIRSAAPDTAGLQEVLWFQLWHLRRSLRQFASVGRGRRTFGRGEQTPVLARRDRFGFERHGHFWLSERPSVVGSIGWDATVARMCTWAVLSDRAAGRRFAVLNTHFDHRGPTAREQSARLLVGRLAQFEGLPVILTGDLNADEDSPTLDVLRGAGLRDTFRVARPEAQEAGTFHKFTGKARPAKIDYVMCDSSWTVLSADILREPVGGRWPSDHFPVVAELALR